MSDTKKQGWIVSSLVGLRDWTNDRLPIVTAWEKHMSKYYAPKNFNFWYFFGVLSLVVLVIQLVSGIVLTMHYTNSAEGAFASVEYIMRDVEFGWLIRYIHSTGASAFFIGVGLAVALPALNRCLCVLRGGLPAYVPGSDVRFVQEAA